MTKSELLAALHDVPDDAQIVLAKATGADNGYTPLDAVATDAIYVADNSYRGEAYMSDSSAEDNLLDEAEWEQLKSQPRAVVLYGVQ